MATGHATYSTVHADSAKSLIHRLEGKPIDIPRVMLQSLDIVAINITTRVKGKRVRRCKQVIEIIDIDPTTKEILTNEAFRWDPIEDKFIYTGKSYVLEGIRARWDITKEGITEELRKRTEILQWMRDNNVRSFREVAKAVAMYCENPDEFLKKIREPKINNKDNKIVEEEFKESIEEEDAVE
jgi:flagellar protein FlaI